MGFMNICVEDGDESLSSPLGGNTGVTQARLFSADPEADQGGAAALQRGGGNAEVPAAPQHRPLPRLLEVHGEGPQMHHPGDGADDVGHAQNVSIRPFFRLV